MAAKINLATLQQYKQESRPITMLTCYDAPTAALLQQAGIDSILVGDSLAQVILGHDSTIHATMDVMVAFTAAVRRGAPDVFLVADMPFLSYQTSISDALTNAGRMLRETGCDIVKLEVGSADAPLIEALSRAGIPTMAHLGYRPQTAQLGQKVVATRDMAGACQLLQDAQTMLQAGASTLLLEAVTETVAQQVTQRSPVPVISCGSGAHCDGQVLVITDVMGLPGAGKAKFSQRFADLAPAMEEAARQYIDQVRRRAFPDDAHSYHMPADQKRMFLDELGPDR